MKLIKSWFITIDKIKYYYTFDKNKRIAKYYTSDGKLANLDIVKENKRKNTSLKKLQSQGTHYVFKSEEERKEREQKAKEMENMKEVIIVSAWYTMDIPVGHGPGDYRGLPGLI